MSFLGQLVRSIGMMLDTELITSREHGGFGDFTSDFTDTGSEISDGRKYSELFAVGIKQHMVADPVLSSALHLTKLL